MCCALAVCTGSELRLFHSFSFYYIAAAFGHSLQHFLTCPTLVYTYILYTYCQYTTVCGYTYTNLHNFFSTPWKHLTQKLCGVCMERAQAIHGNCHRHLQNLLNNFTVDFIKLVTVLPYMHMHYTTLQYSAYVVVCK